MKEKIKEIFKQLYKDKMSLEEAEQQVLDLFAASKRFYLKSNTYLYETYRARKTRKNLP